MARLVIAVAGAARCDARVRELAREVGRRLGEAGATVLTGGRGGVMAAASEGARAAGALVVGLLPGTCATETPPNDAVDLPLYTGLGQARNLVLVLSAAAVIAIGGEWGTLSEIALARKHGRPVVLLESWSVERPDRIPDPRVRSAATPEEAVDLALRAARTGSFPPATGGGGG